MLAGAGLLGGERLERFEAMEGQIVLHDLRRGIPAADGSVDAVYHSHVLEHLDREVASRFLAEVWRVLRPDGIQRIVVPDLAQACQKYLAHFERCLAEPERYSEHDGYVEKLILQMVRREAYGTSRQPPLRRFIENLLLGDARRRGETHQWMYDSVNLTRALTVAGFREIRNRDHLTSAIPDWRATGLDEDGAAGEYKPGSLYVESRK